MFSLESAVESSNGIKELTSKRNLKIVSALVLLVTSISIAIIFTQAFPDPKILLNYEIVMMAICSLAPLAFSILEIYRCYQVQKELSQL